MVDAAELQVLASWSEEQTTADAVVAALARLWQESSARIAGPTTDAGGHGGILRTRVVNFLAYATSPGVCERAASVMAHLAGTHPSRTLLMLAQAERADASLGASARAFCRTEPGGRHKLCFDQIQLTAAGAAAAHLPGMATQLLIHDLPTLLWWPGDPDVAAPAFASMAQICDVLIVDSSEFADPRQKLPALARFFEASHGCPALADLNWNRLLGWREIVAQCFDPPALRPYLDKIRSATIEYAADAYRAGPSAQALLLSGWLAGRLGWELLERRGEAETTVLQFRGGARTLEVRLAPVAPAEHGPGMLRALRIVADDAGKQGSFAIAAADDGSHGTTTVQIADGSPVSRGFHFESASESRLIGEEIEGLGADGAFLDALRAAAAICK